MSVVVLGSANTDMTVAAARLPVPAETITGRSFSLGLGGKGLNQAVASARLGASTAFVGRVGTDAFSEQLRVGLLTAGVDVSDLADDPAHPSGVAVVLVQDGGQNSIVVVPGANGAVGATELAKLKARLPQTCVLVLQLEVPMSTVVASVELAGEHGVTVLLDPAPAQADGLPSQLYASHVILTPNEVEAAALVGFELTDEDTFVRAARELLSRGAGGVVLKLGARGLCWATGGKIGRQPTPTVRVEDTVGAGDAVNGALAAALAAGASLQHATRQAAVAGALAVTKVGAYAAMPSREELDAALLDAPAGLTWAQA